MYNFNLALDFNNPIFQLGISGNNQNFKKSKSKPIPLGFEWTARTDAMIGPYKCIQHKGELNETTLYGKYGEIGEKNDSTYAVRIWSSDLMKRNKTVRSKLKAKYGDAYKFNQGDEGVFNITKNELADFVAILRVPNDRGRQLTNAVSDYYRRRGLLDDF